MAIPDFQTLMRPLLEEYAAGGERPIAGVRAALATRLELTDEELVERLPSGLARTFDNRVGWAATYLYRTGLLARPRRAVYEITDRGRGVLAANLQRVDLGVLSQFPEFAEFTKASGANTTKGGVGVTVPGTIREIATPEERIDAAYQELRQGARLFRASWAHCKGRGRRRESSSRRRPFPARRGSTRPASRRELSSWMANASPR
jgi:restriction system protein